MRFVLDAVYTLVGLLYLPILLHRILVRGKSRTGWGDRLGAVRPRPGNDRCIWLHAVSVGEVNATRTLIEAIDRDLPNLPVVISTTTDTGYARACQVYPDRQVFRYPLDFSWAVGRAIRRLRPAVIMLMELEVWPNLLGIARAKGVPVMIANGRITQQRSMRRFGLPVVRSIATWMFSRLACVATQDETYAKRFCVLGTPADRVHVTGTMKYDTAAVVDHVDGQDELAAEIGIDTSRPLWVCGCTGPGEEAVIVDAYLAIRDRIAGLQLAVIPRKPERFDEAARAIEKRDVPFVRRSTKQKAGDRVDVFLGDTMGELGKFYGLADVVFVGRTMVELGGSDVLEVAGLARPIVVGPSVYNFAEPVRALLAGNAIVQIDEMVDDDDAPASLGTAIADLLETPSKRDALGQAARQVLLANQGATDRTVALLRELVE